jgi:hypothetical protein
MDSKTGETKMLFMDMLTPNRMFLLQKKPSGKNAKNLLLALWLITQVEQHISRRQNMGKDSQIFVKLDPIILQDKLQKRQGIKNDQQNLNKYNKILKSIFKQQLFLTMYIIYVK